MTNPYIYIYRDLNRIINNGDLTAMMAIFWGCSGGIGIESLKLVI